MTKIVKNNRQECLVWCEISKTVFNIFLRKYIFAAIDRVGHWKWCGMAKNGKNRWKITVQKAYVWWEISRSVLKILPAEISRKIQIYHHRQQWPPKTADGGQTWQNTLEIPVLTQILRKVQFCHYWWRWSPKMADGVQKRLSKTVFHFLLGQKSREIWIY